MYSLVNVPALCRDLARHPAGAAVTDDLLLAFALDVRLLADLDRSAEPVRASVRDEVEVHDAGRSRALDVLAATREAAEAGGLAAWPVSIDVLECAVLGGAEELRRLVVDEVLEVAWQRADGLAVALFPRALAVAGDGIAATWATPSGGPAARALGAPWRAWLAAHDLRPAALDDPALASIVEAIRAADGRALAAAAEALRDARAGGWSWARAMHDACWAAHLTGRLRSAAVAQLHALRALLDAAAPLAPRPAAAAAVVAAVHATTVADVLDTPTVAAMTQPLFRSLS